MDIEHTFVYFERNPHLIHNIRLILTRRCRRASWATAWWSSDPRSREDVPAIANGVVYDPSNTLGVAAFTPSDDQ